MARRRVSRSDGTVMGVPCRRISCLFALTAALVACLTLASSALWLQPGNAWGCVFEDGPCGPGGANNGNPSVGQSTSTPTPSCIDGVDYGCMGTLVPEASPPVATPAIPVSQAVLDAPPNRAPGNYPRAFGSFSGAATVGFTAVSDQPVTGVQATVTAYPGYVRDDSATSAWVMLAAGDQVKRPVWSQIGDLNYGTAGVNGLGLLQRGLFMQTLNVSPQEITSMDRASLAMLKYQSIYASEHDIFGGQNWQSGAPYHLSEIFSPASSGTGGAITRSWRTDDGNGQSSSISVPWIPNIAEAKGETHDLGDRFPTVYIQGAQYQRGGTWYPFEAADIENINGQSTVMLQYGGPGTLTLWDPSP